MVISTSRNTTLLSRRQQSWQMLSVATLLLFILLVFPADAFFVTDTTRSLASLHHQRKTWRDTTSNFPLQAKQEKDEGELEEEEKEKEYRPSEDPTLMMIRRQQQGEEKDPFVFQNMVFMDKVNQAIRVTAIAFIVIGIVLNQFGYDFIVRDGKLTVDTLEKKQFETEVVRAMRNDAKKAKEEAGQSVE